MKKLVTWIALGLSVSAGVMVGIHWHGTRELSKSVASLEALEDRREAISSMLLELERYRSMTARFRGMSNEEVAVVKTRFKTSIAQGLASLEKLQPTEEERNLAAAASEKIAELVLTAAKIEPMVYTRDVYQKEVIRVLHESVQTLLGKLALQAEARKSSLRPEISGISERSTRLMAVGAALVLLFSLLCLVREYFAHSRPWKRLLTYVHEVSKGQSPSHHHRPRLRGHYKAVEETLGSLSGLLDTLRKERHQFVMAVANDIRIPLVTLRNGAELLMMPEKHADDSNRKAKAMEMLRSSLYRLNRHLEDLTDLVEKDRGEIRLNEKVVDLGKMLERLATSITGPFSQHSIAVTVPQMPVWTFLDAQRMERALIHLINKLTLQMPQGGRIQASIGRVSTPAFRGVEIHLHEAAPGGHAYPTGPTQDVLKHWVSENGFGVSLAQKILEAHGGTILAAGVLGTGVQFTLRIPEDRIASGMNSSPSGLPLTASASAGGGALESPRIKSMFSQEAVNFGS